jgi:hypothetical protein
MFNPDPLSLISGYKFLTHLLTTRSGIIGPISDRIDGLSCYNRN